MKEDDSIPGFEEVLCRRCPPGTSGEVVDETHGLILERNSGPPGCDQHYAVVQRKMFFDKGLGNGHMGMQGLRWGIGSEVVTVGVDRT